MKQVKVGNILEQTSGIIVHGCNAKGVMGSGLAKQIKSKYPKAFADYKQHLSRRGPTSPSLGSVIFSNVNNQLIIANAITQENYGRDKSVVYVDYGAIESTFEIISSIAKMVGFHLHYPMIGAGLANGDWNRIDKIIDSVLDSHEIERTLWTLEQHQS